MIPYLAVIPISSALLSRTLDFVSPGREDYKPPNRKRLSSPEVDRSFHCTDDTSDDDGGDHFPPMGPRPATRSRTQKGRSHVPHHRENDLYQLHAVCSAYTSLVQDLGFFRSNLVTMPGVLGLSVPTSEGIAVQN